MELPRSVPRGWVGRVLTTARWVFARFFEITGFAPCDAAPNPWWWFSERHPIADAILVREPGDAPVLRFESVTIRQFPAAPSLASASGDHTVA